MIIALVLQFTNLLFIFFNFFLNIWTELSVSYKQEGKPCSITCQSSVFLLTFELIPLNISNWSQRAITIQLIIITLTSSERKRRVEKRKRYVTLFVGQHEFGPGLQTFVRILLSKKGLAVLPWWGSRALQLVEDPADQEVIQRLWMLLIGYLDL